MNYLRSMRLCSVFFTKKRLNTFMSRYEAELRNEYPGAFCVTKQSFDTVMCRYEAELRNEYQGAFCVTKQSFDTVMCRYKAELRSEYLVAFCVTKQSFVTSRILVTQQNILLSQADRIRRSQTDVNPRSQAPLGNELDRSATGCRQVIERLT